MNSILRIWMCSALFYCCLLPNRGIAQIVEYRSSSLDSMIWEKINQHLINLGKHEIHHFKGGSVWHFAQRTCDRLIPDNAPFKHSSNDSISWYSGGECIFCSKIESTGTIELLDHLKNGQLEPLAQVVVDGWLGSESHRRAISQDHYLSSTVAAIVHLDEENGYFRICAAWYQLDDSAFGNLGGF